MNHNRQTSSKTREFDICFSANEAVYFFQRDIIQLYSNNYKNVIKTLHVERKGLSEKDMRRRRKKYSRETVKISSSGNIAKIFSKTQISLQRDEIQF